MLRTAQSAPTRDGGYLLLTYPGCTELYRGPLEGDSVYVVARNTEFERLFRRVDLTAATQWAITNKQQLENIPTVGLCAEAVDELFALV